MKPTALRVNWIAALRWAVPVVLALSAAELSLGQPTNAPSTVVTVPGGTIEVTLPDEPMKLSQKDLLAWVEASAHAVSLYYGHFPVAHLTLVIRSSNGSGVRHGVTYATGGGLIRVSVGREASLSDLHGDWVLVHEMTHLAFPSMPDDQHWIEEGLATYIEPLARAMAGNLTATEVWGSFARDMPQGEPEEGDRGLDHTHTWGRTYWGGAMFCLIADVKIREQTHNRKGLRDALRAIVEGGGDITQNWNIDTALAAGDRGTGTRVLEQLYAQMADKSFPVDLPSLWKELGVSLENGRVLFNDHAPEANIRKSITASSH